MKALRMCVAVLACVLSAGGCAATPGQQPGPALGVIRGQVLAAPVCPVERSASPCPPRGVPGAEVDVRAGSRQVAVQRTTAAGHFEFRLPAGRYVVRATNTGGYASTAEQATTVVAGVTQELTLVVDSGIR